MTDYDLADWKKPGLKQNPPERAKSARTLSLYIWVKFKNRKDKVKNTKVRKYEIENTAEQIFPEGVNCQCH